MELSQSFLKKYKIFFLLTLASIFINNSSVYVILFCLNIGFVFLQILRKREKIKFNKWEIGIIAFMLWTIINTAYYICFKNSTVNFNSFIKILINFSFLLSCSYIIKNNIIKLDKKAIIEFIGLIIIVNFIQVIWIYLSGGLFSDLIRGEFNQSSDAALVLNDHFKIIGNENKNIWSTKIAFIYVIYMYLVSNEYKVKEVGARWIVIFLGLTSIMLLLSRTGQVAILIPLIVFALVYLNQIDRKYRLPIYIITLIGASIVAYIFMTKIFHIEFNLTDGGFTRLVIWNTYFNNIGDTSYILGNGLGSSGAFINSYLGRFESNFHNVYMNIMYEMGVIGILSYIWFNINIFITNLKSIVSKIKYICMLVIPFIIICMLQYLGFDNDIIVFFVFIIIINSSNECQRGYENETN